MPRAKSKPSIDFERAIYRLQVAFRVDFDEDAIRVYWDGLKDFEPSRLNQAIDQAIRTCQFPPRVAELRRIANDVTLAKPRRVIDGQEVFDCPLCEDAGTVVVWSHETVGRLRAGVEPKRWDVYCVACSCMAGDRWARSRTLSNGKVVRALPRYDAWSMRRPQFVAVDNDGNEVNLFTGRYGERERADLLAWIEAPRPIEQHPNYNSEFGEYSAPVQQSLL